jgi:glycerophosphoryl diester phosphodiesterase
VQALRITLISAIAALALAAPAGAQDPWTGQRVLNIAHQGGEDEAPSNTIYAYERAMRLGTDMLELDVHSTADGRLVVMHDAKVDRTTDGSGYVYDMTLAQVQELDAAYDFVPGVGTDDGLDPSSYPFRGVRSGERRPPPGYHKRDFRIPTLDEVLRTYPEVPINIEIKGRADGDNASFARNADLLAALLNRTGRNEGIIVASFNDPALDRFHAQAPQIGMAPAAADVAAFKFASTPLPEGMVAFQVPITFSGLQVTDADFVQRAHEHDYAVHVWLSNDVEDEATYNQLLDWNVDGIMAAWPGRLERVLCQREAPRPKHPKGWPGGPHCTPHSSIACDVRPVATDRRGGRLRVTLVRRDDFSGRCAGRIEVRSGRKSVSPRFIFGALPPSAGGPDEITVRMPFAPVDRVRITARPYEGFPHRATVPVD